MNKYNKYSHSYTNQKINTNYQKTNTNTKNNNQIGDEINNQLKNELLDYVYKNLDIYQLRYSLLKTIEHAQQLKNQQFHITPHYHGYNYLFIIKRLSDNITSIYIIYRMDLKFNRADTKSHYVKIYKLDINQTLDEYDNTIFDGKLIYKKEQKFFIINDMYYKSGIKQLTIKLTDKFDEINKLIIKFNSFLINYFELKLIHIYAYTDMEELVYTKIRNSDFKINGLVFIPIRSNRIFVYTNDEEFEQIKNMPKMQDEQITNIKLPPNINIEEKTLLLNKTLIVDVYEIYTIDKTYRFGICHVPTIELSHKLRKYFETNQELITNCVYDSKFSKWKPIF